MESYLLEGEEILAQAGSLYASNKRLLRYKKHLNGDEFDDIPYSHITSVAVVRNTRRELVKSGIIIAIIGISTLIAVITLMPYLKSISDLWGNPMSNQAIKSIPSIPFLTLDLVSLLSPLVPFSIVIIGIGISLILLGVFMPQVFIQFRAPMLSPNTEAKFRLGDVGKETTIKLVRIVRQKSLYRETESVNIRPTEIGENQLLSDRIPN